MGCGIIVLLAFVLTIYVVITLAFQIGTVAGVTMIGMVLLMIFKGIQDYYK